MIRPGRERNRRAISFRRFRHVTLIQSAGCIRRAVSSHARNESARRRRHRKPPTLYGTSTDRQRVRNRNAVVRVLAGQTDRRNQTRPRPWRFTEQALSYLVSRRKHFINNQTMHFRSRCLSPSATSTIGVHWSIIFASPVVLIQYRTNSRTILQYECNNRKENGHPIVVISFINGT